jgi:hypothetical protein
MTRLLLAFILIATPLAAQAPPPASRPGATAVAASDTTATARIIREIAEHQQAVGWTEYLSDVIGPRLTTSPQIAHAHAWAESTMTRFGATNVHQEGYEFGPSWTRGEATARLLTQNGKSLELAAAGWSASTKGAVRGDLVVVQASTVDGLRKFIGQFKGKFVTYGELPPRGSDTAEARMVGAQLVSAMEKEGALGFILNAGNHDGLVMTGGPVWRLGAFVPRIPVAFMARKDYLELRRLAEHGKRVTLEVNLPSTTSKKPVQQYNTIGEIRGSEKPGEVVIIGGHIDSWDLGTGATDNGTGVASVMEALRAIKASGLTPKRTIRVVLFSGEEQGHWGSKAYVEAHKSELDSIQAVLILDLGTGKVLGWALQGREESRRLMASAIAPLNDLGVNELPLERSGDSDHASFTDAGVPAFFAIQDTLNYFSVTHHSQYDTFDQVKPDQLTQAATAVAVTAWELAEMRERLPHW